VIDAGMDETLQECFNIQGIQVIQVKS
jgi:hypothetical protein